MKKKNISSMHLFTQYSQGCFLNQAPFFHSCKHPFLHAFSILYIFPGMFLNKIIGTRIKVLENKVSKWLDSIYFQRLFISRTFFYRTFLVPYFRNLFSKTFFQRSFSAVAIWRYMFTIHKWYIAGCTVVNILKKERYGSVLMS